MTHRRISQAIADAARRHGPAVFLRDARSDRGIRFAELADRTAVLGARLADARRVLVDVEDPLDFAVAHLGVMAAGRASVPVDPSAPVADLARTVRATAPDLIISSAPARWDGGPTPVLDPAVRTGPPAADGSGGSVLLQTSGSTGDPKLIELYEQQQLHVATAVARHNRLTADDVGYNPLPLFHINGQIVGLLASLVAGSALVLDRRFHRTGFWPLIDGLGVTWINAVPAMLSILAREPLPHRPPALRFVRSASAPLPPAVRRRVVRELGVPVIESYGMTEAASQITATALDDDAPGGTVGRPVGSEVQVRAAAGEVGPVWIRGAGVITAYADGRAGDRFDADGWLATGDLGRLDGEGRLVLAGRADDVINRGGELVYPREVEEVLMSHPSVRDAVVVGRPDEILSAVPVALLTVADHAAGTDHDVLIAQLQDLCARQLSPFKRPVQLQVVTEFPRASVGKIRRHLVREAAAGD